MLRPMDISFASPELRTLCKSEDRLREALGDTGARRLQNRLDDFRNALAMAEVYMLPYVMLDDQNRTVTIQLDDEGMVAVLVVCQNRIPEDESGAPDWSAVGRLKLVSVGAENA